MSQLPVLISEAELNRQREIAALIAALPERPGSYHIVTYGCQMNAHDSEKLAGILESMGMREASDRLNADLVLFNTCCIRDNAERRALGNVVWLNELKKRKPGLMIGVCGCMVQQPLMAQRLIKRYPFVDLAFGTHNLHQLPAILYELLTQKKRVVSVSEQENLIAEGLPVRRQNDYKAFITIMYGCNNYCSYCIVPYVRGRERSRRMAEILTETEALIKSGTQEIMLLGQNVNSYGNGSDETFPQLLRALDAMGVPRIRFMTSHPKDLSDELIGVMAEGKHICNHLHLPVQSGSEVILQTMNRRYTRAEYLGRVKALRQAVPNIGLTTDFIVGFPGETEAQFEDTVSLVDAVGYDGAFTFIFSPRAGTKAASLEGQVSPEVAGERLRHLITAVEAGSSQAHRQMLGQMENVLVESVSKRDQNMVSGKGTRGITITLPGTPEDIGKIVPVKITSSAVNTLRAERT
ncbi:MAG: tRNA (N6-isopentenyl adenosine(37)-C2)-methylthiotransferase MiaB [Eubacteriales bacterium]|nr:tRNA (N6-isopentenyl adenosine(37)-C2)-methylthiotransferase MiaB [Eubacteriales bacterium]